MGIAKNQEISDWDSGWQTGRNLNVCQRHFEDEDIVKFIEAKGTINRVCDFCNSAESEEEETLSVISWDELMGRIMPAFHRFFDDPANGLGFESAEGGYYGNEYSTYEVLNEHLELEADQNIVEEIADTIVRNSWTEAEFYGHTDLDQLNYDWDFFSKLVKYKVRYVFYEIKSGSGFGENSRKSFQILNDIGKIIKKLDLVVSIPEKSNLFNQSISIYRARQHSRNEKVKSCKDIGSAPQKYAGANRFSAEGISIFYGAEDKKTARDEAINKKDKTTKPMISVGEFRPNCVLNLVDLRKIPRIGFFNVEKLKILESVQFLRNFATNISKPI